MTYGEMKSFVLQLLHQYTVAGDEIPDTYNGQADDLLRIPLLTRDAVLYVTTTNRKLRAVAELAEPESSGNILLSKKRDFVRFSRLSRGYTVPSR